MPPYTKCEAGIGLTAIRPAGLEVHEGLFDTSGPKSRSYLCKRKNFWHELPAIMLNIAAVEEVTRRSEPQNLRYLYNEIFKGSPTIGMSLDYSGNMSRPLISIIAGEPIKT